MKSGLLKKIFIAIIALPFYLTTTSYSGGITGVSQAGGCSCHGASSTNTSVTISPAIPSFSYGQKLNFTITVANSSMTTATSGGGFNLSSNIGTLKSLNSETQLVGTELTHTARKASSTGSVSWVFEWDAPTSGSGPLQFFIAGNAVDGMNGNGGDQWNFGTIASIPLPVDFISFKASSKNKEIALNWEIGNKVNASHFDILRSADGFDFSEIGSLKITEKSIYNFTDDNPIVGVNYYKLREVDFDGQTQFSDVVTQIQDGGNIRIYPSLVEDGKLHIDDLKDQKISLKLLSSNGKVINYFPLDESNNSIDLSQFSNGVYFAIIETKSKEILKTKKFVIAN